MKRTLASIEAEIEKLKAAAAKLQKEEVAGVIGRIRTAIAHYGLSADDLFGAAAGRKAKAVASPLAAAGATSTGVAKYRDPASGKTWTGRGKPPNWIAGVADRSKFLIDGADAGTAAAPAKSAGRPRKAAEVKRGGVAKYQDPASGKTWTGMGKPPGWIAGASDRSAYLIGGASAAPAAAPAAKGAKAAKGRATGKRKGGAGTAQQEHSAEQAAG